MKIKNLSLLLALLLLFTFLLPGCSEFDEEFVMEPPSAASVEVESALLEDSIVSVNDVPPFTDQPYVAINNNIPVFPEEDYKPVSFEKYGDLDSLGRCTVAYACVGKDLMPTEERGSIGQVKPTGWQSTKYDNVDGKYLYNRCHLIGFQLTGENANQCNLITGTRYLNIDGMLPFENMVADFVKETGIHVLYRVTPIFDGENLVSRGVQMEGKSVEDNGEGICFNVYAYNNQPDIEIDYATGESRLSDSAPRTYILNTGSHKFHNTTCKLANDIKEGNKQSFFGRRDELIQQGYEPCKICNP